jgi:hypothetical protein
MDSTLERISSMYKSIDIWKRIGEDQVVRYRCFQRLRDGLYCVQSADFYSLPLDEVQVKYLDNQFLEFLIEEEPDQRAEMHETLEEAILIHEKDFE